MTGIPVLGVTFAACVAEALQPPSREILLVSRERRAPGGRTLGYRFASLSSQFPDTIDMNSGCFWAPREE